MTEPMRVVVGIVAHERRRVQAERLAQEVHAAVCNIDDGTLGCEGNHVAVLHMLSLLDADWCVVLEDDAVVTPDFLSHVKRALEHAPAPIVGLYLGTGNPSGEVQRQIRQAVMEATDLSRAWIVGDALIGAVGYAIRASLIPDMLGWIAGDYDAEHPLRISRWAQDWDLRVAYTQPSLVDHADNTPIGYSAEEFQKVPGGRRKAWNYGSQENWHTPAVELGHCPGWSAPAWR